MKTNSSACVPQSCPKVQVKLPPIYLPTFDGNVLCWQPYNQSIEVSVVDNSALAEVQKLEYLMKSLKGPTAEAVKGFSVVQENFHPVLEALKERFGHPGLILDAHVRSLIHMHLPHSIHLPHGIVQRSLFSLEAGQVAQTCEKPPCKHCRGKKHSLLHMDSVSSGSSATPPS